MAETPTLTATDLYGFDEALAYINAARVAAGEPPLSVAGFRRHVYGGKLFQLEPIPLGMRARMDGPDRATGVVFTRRMLDEYLACRTENARRGAERQVTRPTDAERAQVLGSAAAAEYVNKRLAHCGRRVTDGNLRYYRRRGDLLGTETGRAAAYTTADLDAFVARLAAREHGA